MHSIVYSALPGKVLFGFGTIDKVADEIRQLGYRRAFVLSTPQQALRAEGLAARLGDPASEPLPERPCTLRLL
jgi:alcohol dehydrogenase class IV